MSVAALGGASSRWPAPYGTTEPGRRDVLPGSVVRAVRLGRRGSGVLGDQRVHAVLVVHLAAGDRRVGHAHAADLLAHPHLVLVVVVEQVQRAGGELVHLARGQILDLALAVGDEDGLDVVGVPEVALGALVQGGLVDGEAHALLGQDDALGAPGVRLDVGVGVLDVGERANEHGVSFRWWSWVRGAPGRAPAQTVGPPRRATGRRGSGLRRRAPRRRRPR